VAFRPLKEVSVLRTDSLDKTLSLADQKNGDFYISIKKELFIFAQVFN